MSSDSRAQGLIGHIGMIASRSDVKGEDAGRLYVLREPAGMLTTLIGSDVPLSAWLARGLSSPTNGITCPPRDIYIADRCVVPVSQISELELEVLISAQNQREFDAAVAETQESMGDSENSEAEMDAMIERAARQFFMQFSLGVAAVSVTLREIGFSLAEHRGSSLVWLLEDAGLALHLNFSAFLRPLSLLSTLADPFLSTFPSPLLFPPLLPCSSLCSLFPFGRCGDAGCRHAERERRLGRRSLNLGPPWGPTRITIRCVSSWRCVAISLHVAQRIRYVNRTQSSGLRQLACQTDQQSLF